MAASEKAAYQTSNGYQIAAKHHRQQGSPLA